MNLQKILFLAGLAVLLAGCAFRLNPYSLDTTQIDLPFAQADAAIHEIWFDPRIERVIVPGGEAGGLALVDPSTGQPRLVGSSASGVMPKISSAAVARGIIFAVGPSAKEGYIIDPDSGSQIGVFPLQEAADIIRFVPTNNELWVTQPAANQIEVFALSDATPPAVEHSGVIHVDGGPQGLIVDRSNGVAYTNQPDLGTTAEIQIFTRRILNSFANGCTEGRDLAIDEERRYLFVACAEGKLVVIGLNEKGSQLGSINYGGELDGLAYNSQLRHIYLPSGASGIVAVFAVEPAGTITGTPPAEAAGIAGEGAPLDPDLVAATATAAAANPVASSSKVRLVRIATADTAVRANCITTDGSSSLWVCDPVGGGVFLIKDDFPAN